MELSNSKYSYLMHTQQKYGPKNDHLIEGFNIIFTMVDKLELVKTIKDHAMEIFKQMKELNFIRG